MPDKMKLKKLPPGTIITSPQCSGRELMVVNTHNLPNIVIKKTESQPESIRIQMIISKCDLVYIKDVKDNLLTINNAGVICWLDSESEVDVVDWNGNTPLTYDEGG